MTALGDPALESVEALDERSSRAELLHVVHFYPSDEDLCEGVTEFLAAGIAAGEPLVVVATDAHSRAFGERLKERGVDLEGALLEETIAFLDARTILARIMVGSLPDWTRFRRVIGGVLDRCGVSREGASVRVYGELVDLLWKDGNAAAAIRLEEMWNELQKTCSFSLYCAYAGTSPYAEPEIDAICAPHTHVTDGRGGLASDAVALTPERLHSLVSEIGQRKDIERALRASVRDLRKAHDQLRARQHDLEDFVEHAPVGLHWVGADGMILWANTTELELLGYTEEEYVGHHIGEFHADPAAIEDILRRLSRTEKIDGYEARLKAKDGSIKQVLISSNVRWEDGVFQHTRCFTRDVTQQRRLDEARAAVAKRTERLTEVTSAIADAVTPDQVFEAVVDRVAAALGASSGSLWVVDQDRKRASLVRAVGYRSEAAQLGSVSLETAGYLPTVDAIRTGAAVWIAGQRELLELYPHLAPLITPGRRYRIACFPVVGGGAILGSLGFTFETAGDVEDELRDVLAHVARYAGQALERLRLLDAERKSRAHAEASAARAEALYRLARAVIDAESVNDVFAAALLVIEETLGASRSSILVLDGEGAMRFKAWRGISDAYRRAVDGHAPRSWREGDPKPIFVSDAENDPSMVGYLPALRAERIGALGFIPLVASGKLLGKFMMYYEGRRDLASYELDLAVAIANHVAAGIGRFAATEELQRTIHFNEMFTAILGHDLRNPLAGIASAAQLAAKRADNERMLKLLMRIQNSSGRMERMIDQLLDFTRVRVGRGIPIQPRPADLVPLLREVLDELDGANQTPALRLEHSGDTAGVWDADRLAQAFSNLIGNALQHGAPEGGVRVRIDGSARDSVRVEVHNLGAVPRDLLPRLFEPLSGGDQRRDGSRGLGLGLFITRSIVAAHGGAVDVSSGEGEGTTFTLSLPRLVGHEASAEAGAGEDSR